MHTLGGIYKHYKGGLYRIISTALLENNLEEMVIYESLADSKDLPRGTRFVRPRSEFEGLTTHEGQMVPRFSLLKPNLIDTLTLDKPIVFFDLETTGVDIYNDKIVEIAIVKIETDGTEKEYEWIINPGIPIPEGAAAVHGITDEMVKDAPRFSDIAAEISTIFDGVYIGGYNVKNFDVPLLLQECQRIGLELPIDANSIIDPMSIYRQKETRTLSSAVKEYCGVEMENAHEAMADIRATVDVLTHQLLILDDVPKTAPELALYCYPIDPDAFDLEGKLRYVGGELAINFGKNKGKTLVWLARNDRGYLEWILNGTFSEQVKTAVRDCL